MQVVLGPAVDGGYYLIGVTKAPKALFQVSPKKRKKVYPSRRGLWAALAGPMASRALREPWIALAALTTLMLVQAQHHRAQR